MTTRTLSGTLSIGAIDVSGTLVKLAANSGPSTTRQSTIQLDLSMKGNYFDELDGIKNDEINWKADGFKYTDRTGTGLTAGGQSNRFWRKKDLKIEYGSYIDLDMHSFLSLDAGKGYGQDNLGLGIVMDQITLLAIRNKAEGSDLTIGGAANAPWTSLLTGTMTLPRGHTVVFQTKSIDAWDVTAGTSQFLRLAPQGTACTVDVYIAGRDQ